MHQNDSMQRERAMAILLIFRHPLLKLEKNKSFEQPSEPKKYAYHGRNFSKVHFTEVSWLDSFHFSTISQKR